MLSDGEVRHAVAVLQQLQAVRGVVRVQLVQENLNGIALRVVCPSDADWMDAPGRLERAVHGLMNRPVAIRIVRVSHIEPEPGGKVRAVVSRCQPDRTAAE